MNLLRRLIRAIRKPAAPDATWQVQPRVTPDPDSAAALERRRAALSYMPRGGFLTDRSVTR